MKTSFKFIIILTFLSLSLISNGQINIGDESPVEEGLALKLTSQNKGVIFPRYALTSKLKYTPTFSTEPPTGTIVFNTNTFGSFPEEMYPGLYWWNRDDKQWYPFAMNMESYTAKFSNRDETTDLFKSYFVKVPIFGALDFADIVGEYQIVSSSGVKFNSTGLYSFTVNLDLWTGRSQNIGIEIRLLKNGKPFNSTKWHAISQQTEHFFTEIFTEYITIDKEGDIISIEARAVTGGDTSSNSYTIRMNEKGSSTVVISRIR